MNNLAKYNGDATSRIFFNVARALVSEGKPMTVSDVMNRTGHSFRAVKKALAFLEDNAYIHVSRSHSEHHRTIDGKLRRYTVQSTTYIGTKGLRSLFARLSRATLSGDIA